MDITFGERLLLLRKRADLSQTQLSFRLAVPERTIEDWETDKAMPSLNEAKYLADILNCSIDFLVARIDKDIDFDLIKRAEAIQAMEEGDFKETALYTMDVLIREYQRKQIMQE